MAKQKGGDAPESAPAPEPKKLYEVRLPHAPTRRVEAADPADAWEAYKRSCGLVATENAHEVVEVSDAAQE